MSNIAPVLETISVRKKKDFHGADSWTVTPFWKGVDRPDSRSFCCGANKALAYRLAKAFRAGVCYEDAHTRTDDDGKTFVSFGLTIRMRCVNADLSRLGY